MPRRQVVVHQLVDNGGHYLGRQQPIHYINLTAKTVIAFLSLDLVQSSLRKFYVQLCPGVLSLPC